LELLQGTIYRHFDRSAASGEPKLYAVKSFE
jgi:hypothetical protein